MVFGAVGSFGAVDAGSGVGSGSAPDPRGCGGEGESKEQTQVDAVIKALRGEPSVEALYSTNGRWDIVAELGADNLESFDRVLGRIRLIEGISQTESSLLLSTFKV